MNPNIRVIKGHNKNIDHHGRFRMFYTGQWGSYPGIVYRAEDGSKRGDGFRWLTTVCATHGDCNAEVLIRCSMLDDMAQEALDS